VKEVAIFWRREKVSEIHETTTHNQPIDEFKDILRILEKFIDLHRTHYIFEVIESTYLGCQIER